MATDGEPQPGAAEPSFDQTQKDRNLGEYRQRQTSEDSGFISARQERALSARLPVEPLTPNEIKLLKEAREKATEYGTKRLDFTGLDGNRLPHEAVASLIRIVNEEALSILYAQSELKMKGEPTDEVQYEYGITLLGLAAQASLQETSRQRNFYTYDDIQKALAEIHAGNPLTKADTFENLMSNPPTTGQTSHGEQPKPPTPPQGETT